MKKRKNWPRCAVRFGSERLVFVDEMAVTTQMIRDYGWGPLGERVEDSVPGSWKTLGVISAVRAGATNPDGTERPGGPFASATYPKAFNTEVFLLWVTDVLCPQLQPGEVVVLDNVRFHHAPEVRKAIRSVGCRVRFVPPYSPDLNPIEMMWSKIKTILRTARARTIAAIREALPSAFAAVTAGNVAGWLRHSYPRIVS